MLPILTTIKIHQINDRIRIPEVCPRNFNNTSMLELVSFKDHNNFSKYIHNTLSIGAKLEIFSQTSTVNMAKAHFQ